MTPRAPLLSAAQAAKLATMRGTNYDFQCQPEIEALATGRTRCVEVLTEDEHRTRFEAWAKSIGWKPTESMFSAYAACARANGLVKGEKG